MNPQQPQLHQHQLPPPQQTHTIDKSQLAQAFASVCIRVYISELNPGHRVTELDVRELAALSSAIQAVQAIEESTALAEHQEEKGRSVITP